MAKGVKIFLNLAMIQAIKKKLRIEICSNCGEDLDIHNWITMLPNSKSIVNCNIRPVR
jgi:hypothetical protein